MTIRLGSVSETARPVYRSTHTNLGGVVGGTEDQLRSSVVSRTDVADIWLVFHQNLSASKVAKLQDTAVWIEKKILWLDVSVADSLRVDVGERTEELVDVQLDLQNWHGGLHLVEVAGGPVHGFGNELEHQVEVDLIFL